MELLFRVDGVPVPQGSKVGFVRGGRAVLVEANKKLPTWRSEVARTATIAMLDANQVAPFVGPVKVHLTFFMPRPAKPKWDQYPASKPDLDKLIRAVFDSLTHAGVWHDDSQAVHVVAQKLWCGVTTDTYPSPGVSVFVTNK